MSKRQQNCIRDYADRIRKGKCYIYKVIYEAEEATLEVVKKKGNRYTISELTGFRNCRVSDKLNSLVLDWIRTSNCNLNLIKVKINTSC